MIDPLDEFGFQFKDDGIPINMDGFPTADAVIDVKEVIGLDMPKYKVHRNNYDSQDGGIIKVGGLEMRDITIKADIIGGTDPIEPLLDDLKENFRGDDINYPLYLKFPGVNMRQVFCKGLGVTYSIGAARRMNCTPIEFSVAAEDPVVYGTTLYELPMKSAAPMPGHVFDHAFDYGFGGLADPGGLLATNLGNKPVGFLVELTGQSVFNPVITSLTEGRELSLSITVGSNDVLLIDFYNRMVTLNGQRYRGAVVNEGWFKLQPGQTQLRFVDNSGTQLIAVVKYWDGYE
jgi:hypothetical protein